MYCSYVLSFTIFDIIIIIIVINININIIIVYLVLSSGCSHSNIHPKGASCSQWPGVPWGHSPGTLNSSTLLSILTVPNSVVFCSSPILTLIPSFCPLSKFLRNISKDPYNNRYHVHVFHTPHLSNFSLQFLIFSNFFQLLLLLLLLLLPNPPS